MNEQARLEALLEYKILDTPPEKELDELIEIASAICGTRISLISLIDSKRQWFKAVKGLQDKETLREDSFCQHALSTPKEVLVVNDPQNDYRFKDNRYVKGSPHIRFYAGAPLETPNGNVLGTLCIIDDKPHDLSKAQEKALQLLAKKAMDFLNARKRIIEQEEKIELDAARLKKLTDQAPGCIYQFEMDHTGRILFHFVSKGISQLNPMLTPDAVKAGLASILDAIVPEHQQVVRDAITASYKSLRDLNVEFRIVHPSDNVIWYSAHARPERINGGRVMWYGMFQDISSHKLYEEAIEQISFDISHVMRRPVATMLGLTYTIQHEKLSEEQMSEYLKYIKIVSEEMDNFTRRLTTIYSEKQEKLRH